MASLTPKEKKLDRVFSKWVRYTNANRQGLVQCVTCRKLGDPKNFHAGHFIDRTYKCTRWDERNVHPQCVSCNTFHEGQKDEYALYLIKRYGESILEELNRLKHSICKFDDFQIEQMIETYAKDNPTK